MDLVFLNIAFKGYKKEEDVRFALSADEFLIEIRDRSVRPNKVHRLCNTLNKTIDLQLSEVQFFVDFICVKLYKLEKSESWAEFGYDISNFTVPPSGKFKSNFIQPPKVEEPEKKEEEEVKLLNGLKVGDKIEMPKFEPAPIDPYENMTEEEKLAAQEEEIRKTIESSQSNQASFLLLGSESSIFTIY